jgi:hypothetical protein
MKVCMGRKEMIMFLICGPLTVFSVIMRPAQGFEFEMSAPEVWERCEEEIEK